MTVRHITPRKNVWRTVTENDVLAVFSGQIILRASGIGRSGLFRLCCIKLGTHLAEQTLGALGEGFAKLPLTHELVKVKSAGFKCLHSLNELISASS